jgi:hypothetical protein
MPRTRLTIPYGRGLDRLSGTAVVDPSSQVDLRNVYLAPGRMELRRGLGSGVSVGWGTDVIGICPARKTGLLALVVYDSATRGVRLYSFDGTTMSLVGALWTIDAAVASHLPRVLMADVYDKIFIAHDEQNFQYRNTTKVFTVTDSAVADLTLNLDRIAPQAVKFRGVVRHLSYLVGWGYGTASDPNRPETVRISAPGDPTNFTPEHYFNVGARSDPILAAGPVIVGESAQLVLGKQDECWRLVGYDRQSFGVIPLDTSYGFLTSRGHVTVEGELFMWSLQGPRSTIGGPTKDLSLPLDLTGTLPDPAAQPSDDGFAWYDPDEQEVVFCFGAWAYVLHLRDGQRRWSYRSFGRSLSSAGLLFSSTGTGTLSFITATMGVVTTAAPTYTPGDDLPKFTVPWTLSGAGTGNEKVELYGRAELFGTPGHFVVSGWKKLGEATASALTMTVTIPYFMTNFELAIRVVSGGTPGAGFTNSSQCDTWPAFARSSKVSAGTISSFNITGLWERRSPTIHGQPFTYVGPGSTGGSHPELSFVYEQRTRTTTDGGATWSAWSAWGPHAAGTYSTPLTGSVHTNADRLVQAEYRLTVSGPSASTSQVTAASTATLAPLPPSIVSIDTDSGELTGIRHLHPVVVAAGAHGGNIEVRGYHTPDGSWSPTYTVPGGSVELVAPLDNTGGADNLAIEARTRIDEDFSVIVSDTWP